MRLVIEEKKLVMLLYFGTLLGSLLTVVDNVFFVGPLYYIKYLYVIAIAFFCFYDGVIVVSKRLIVGLGLLVLHTLLYGFVFLNPYVAGLTSIHIVQLVMVYAMVFFTCIYVYKKDCFTEFLEMSYLALAIFMLWCAFTHLGDFVNPIYYVNIFSRMGRFRAPFGMGDVNYCGNYCLYTLILSIFLLRRWKLSKRKVDKRIYIAMVIVAIVTLCMLFSTASRSAILSLVLFGGILLLLDYWYLIMRYWKIILAVCVFVGVIGGFVLISTGALESMWSESNREGNFDINLPIFLAHGNLLHGMGYIDNSGYLNMEYGYPTTAMDVYFLYIPFSTGIVGSVLIFGQMIYLLFQLLTKYKVTGRNEALALFGMMMFYAVWQVNYMNARYHTGIIHMVILFMFLMEIRKEKDNYIFVLKRGS